MHSIRSSSLAVMVLLSLCAASPVPTSTAIATTYAAIAKRGDCMSNSLGPTIETATSETTTSDTATVTQSTTSAVSDNTDVSTTATSATDAAGSTTDETSTTATSTTDVAGPTTSVDLLSSVEASATSCTSRTNTEGKEVTGVVWGYSEATTSAKV
ncbi:hypothetical protein NliqN6_2916 [Naganishia liquefaciens]|uniref:Uncharacterized protein n=1 Tax=Naganishia liquefaciens TaxID=104408 RepID=A0A8H3YEI5_9TREE|nr:hypothetical protein NliqN6_2916 [Naganishia liquefaciens]